MRGSISVHLASKVTSLPSKLPHPDSIYLGVIVFKLFIWGGYTVGNLVLRRRVSRAVKHDFPTYIRQYSSPYEKFEYGYPHSNVLLKFYT